MMKNNNIEYVSPYCHVEYLERDNVVLLTWKKFCCFNDYREPTMFAANLLKKYSNSNFIVDARNGFEDEKEDVEWGFNVLLPTMAQSDCKYCIFIMNEVSNIDDEIDLWTKEFMKYFIVKKVLSYEEAKEFAEIVYEKGWQVISIDLPEHGERKEETDRFNPWCVVPELQSVLRYMQSKWKKLALRANSIGAWFSMQSFEGSEFERSLFVSPIIDMEKLIKDMMMWSEVSEKRLKEESIIATEFGETLSWEYYEYARQHKINKWDCKTEVLYAGNDNMTSKETVEEFVHKFEVKLTIMDNGEHWFHTPEQLEVLEAWTKRSCYDILL